MAAPEITPAAVQAALGTNPNHPRIVRADQTITATVGAYYVTGGVAYPGKAKWCGVTNTDDAATQAAAVLVALAAGNAAA